MKNLKKIISLNEASKISGYAQDYLGYLIRTGEIKGEKKGRIWFTTEEDVNDYLLKKKIRSNKVALLEFFSVKRTRNIFLGAFVGIFIISLLITILHKGQPTQIKEIRSGVMSDGESIKLD